MINFYLEMILLALTLHFIGDFLLQTHQMACNKSKSTKWLLYHVSVYSFCFLIMGVRFAIFMFATHYVIDYFTSRITSKLWAKEDYHNFFVVIGMDQLLHMFCIIAAVYRFYVMEAVI